MLTAPEILQALQEKFPDTIIKSEMGVLDPYVYVKAEEIAEVCAFLKEHLQPGV